MRNKGFASVLDKYSRVMLLLVIIIGMSILRPDAFLTWSNMSTVIFQQAPFTMLMSFGMTLAIITKGIDTSMGSVLVLSSVLVAGFIKSGNMVLGIVMALCIGAACGALNGVLITRVGIAPFIATYGVDWVALGLAFVYTGGVYIYDFPEKFRSIANGQFLGLVPNVAVVTIAVFLVLWFVTCRTTYGRNIYSAGNNMAATALSGVNAKNIVLSVYVINGLLAATTGILYMAKLNAADPGISGSFTLDSIAAALIGGTSFEGGKGSVAHTVVGALIIIFIRNGMNILGVATTWQQAVVGGVILLSIVLEKVTQKMVAGSKRKAAAAA